MIQPFNFRPATLAVNCTDVNTCYAVANDGDMRKTIDGGANWVTQFSLTNDNLESVDCPVANTCYAIGGDGGDGGRGTIIKTTDGGVNWLPQTFSTSKNLTSVDCPDVSTCYAVGNNGRILKTMDYTGKLYRAFHQA